MVSTRMRTPAPAPARVTADPPKTKPAKNPGRVASGKRLAERNRLAREALARETEAKATEPAPTKTEDSASDSSSSSSLSLGAVLGIGSLIVGVGRLVLPARGNHGQAKACTSTAGTNARTGAVSHSGETRPKENGLSFENTIYTPHHGRFCTRDGCRLCCFNDHTGNVLFQQSSSGNSVFYKHANWKSPHASHRTTTTPEIEYVPMKHTCNDDDCTIVCCFCDSDHYSCYDCTKEKLKP